jgi:hypothetical protein
VSSSVRPTWDNYKKAELDLPAQRQRRALEYGAAIALMPACELPDAMREACTTMPLNALYLRLLLDRGAAELEKALTAFSESAQMIEETP